MTNYVPKGAGRPAAAARRKKHDQRTPLPPKGGVQRTDQEPIEEPAREPEKPVKRGRQARTLAEPSGTPTASEKPAARKAAGGSRSRSKVSEDRPQPLTPGQGAKGRSGLQEAASAPSRGARPARGAQGTGRTAPKGTNSSPALEAPKVAALLAYCDEVGWSAQAKEPHPGAVIVTATRGEEVIEVSFINGHMDADQMPTYTVGNRTIKMRNVSACKKQMAIAEQEALEANSRVVHRSVRKREDGDGSNGSGQPRELRRDIPWDADAPDEEILSMVIGKRLVWRNTIAGTYDDAYVYPHGVKQKHLRIVVKDGKRILNWASVDGGFRSVYLDNLVQVR